MTKKWKINWYKGMDQIIYKLLMKNAEIMPMRLVKLIAYHYTDARTRKKYLERLGVKMGEGTYSNLGLMVAQNHNKFCVLIGNHVSIAPYVTFVCDSVPNNGLEIKELDYVKNKLLQNGNIIVEDEVWLGANVTILPGIRIGKCSIIGAGSVVTKNVEPYAIYAGVPARKIRSLAAKE